MARSCAGRCKTRLITASKLTARSRANCSPPNLHSHSGQSPAITGDCPSLEPLFLLAIPARPAQRSEWADLFPAATGRTLTDPEHLLPGPNRHVQPLLLRRDRAGSVRAVGMNECCGLIIDACPSPYWRPSFISRRPGLGLSSAPA